MRKLFFVFIAIYLFASDLFSQELNCNVQIVSEKIPGSDKRIYETLRLSIWEFMNNRKWTNNVFKNEERIECSMLINLTERNNDEFSGTIQIQVRRPVYKTTYNTVLLNFIDKDFNIKYVESQPLDYNDNTFISNLTSVLAFYSYIIIGLDYDTFSLYGGMPFYEKAQAIVNSAQSIQEKGWKSFESMKNRYWILENLTNQNYKAFRESLYKYHRIGMDVMSEKNDNARQTIISCIDILQKLNREKPNLYIVQLFFTAKCDEIVNIFTQAPPMEKAQIIKMLNDVDPGNAGKYKGILTNK